MKQALLVPAEPAKQGTHRHQESVSGLRRRLPDNCHFCLCLKTWKQVFDNYIPNIDERTQLLNFNQEVEQDAYGYGLALLNMYYIRKKDFIFRYSMPDVAYQIADLRSRKYYQELPEFQKYLMNNGFF